MSRLVFLSSPVGSSGPVGGHPQDKPCSNTSMLREMWTSANVVGCLLGQSVPCSLGFSAWVL